MEVKENKKGFVGENPPKNPPKNRPEMVVKLIKIINEICEMAGYKVENRIVLRNIKTGHVYK